MDFLLQLFARLFGGTAAPAPSAPVATSPDATGATLTTTVLYTMPNGQPVYREHVGNVTKRVYWKGRARDDGDGRGPSHGDPDYQPRTTYCHNGQYLDADADRYIVVYPQIVNGVPEEVIGSQARVTRISTGKTFTAVAGDIGPHNGEGEMSNCANEAAGNSGSPTSGGDNAVDYLYELFPGQPAFVDDVTYQLQRA